MARKRFGRELWDRMAEFVREPDGLHEEPCGQWSLDKLFVLGSYLAQTTQAMIGNPNFASLNYVDLFAGSGVCCVKAQLSRYPGSALLAAGCRKPFDNLYLVEQDRGKLDALRQ